MVLKTTMAIDEKYKPEENPLIRKRGEIP